jgi:hypothetical protein
MIRAFMASAILRAAGRDAATPDAEGSYKNKYSSRAGRYRWLRHRLKNYNEQNFIIIAILIMIAAHLSFLLLLSFLFLFLL